MAVKVLCNEPEITAQVEVGVNDFAVTIAPNGVVLGVIERNGRAFRVPTPLIPDEIEQLRVHDLFDVSGEMEAVEETPEADAAPEPEETPVAEPMETPAAPEPEEEEPKPEPEEQEPEQELPPLPARSTLMGKNIPELEALASERGVSLPIDGGKGEMVSALLKGA